MSTMSNRPIIYFDAAATTQCTDAVTAALVEFSDDSFGNPSSPHSMGRSAKLAVDQATASIACLLGCSCDELTLTSGATESNNIVVLGCADPGSRQNIVICPIDHKSTLAAASEMQRRGIELRRMRVDANGRIDIKHLASIVDANTALVTISYVNSEIGTIQDIAAISAMIKNNGALFHVDASQAAGKIDISSPHARIDCISISAHKICGPKGIGSLYVSSAAASRLRPLTFGGGQYRLRSGTLPVPLIVGFGIAAERINNTDFAHQWEAANYRRQIILEALRRHNVIYQLNSPTNNAVPHILNFSFPRVRSETIIKGLPTVCIASGSACNSKSILPSHVLTEVGYEEERVNTAIRLSFTADMDIEKIALGADIFAKKVCSLQKLITWEENSV
ncbi:aminotransferase class-V family protein [Collimonas fungivorans]|uniref:cysteine desulfurase n=1 Tax=Collimonas fungivorans TaxID=158899 RepID=A0A127PD65_9BURK|nr:cysteine desulfurase family protein [Collimonas fungivorans]AMO95663.1 aminotransferase class-V family protein [Collimonas fungivorans]